MVGCLSPKKFCWLNLNRQIYMSNPTCFPVNFRCLSVGHHKKSFLLLKDPGFVLTNSPCFLLKNVPNVRFVSKQAIYPKCWWLILLFGRNMALIWLVVTVIIMRSIFFPWKIQWIRVSSPCFLKHIEKSPIFSLFLVDLVAKNCRWISSSAWPICNAWVLGVWTMWRPGSGGPIPPCRCRPSDLWRRVRHMTTWCRVPGGESEWKWRLLVDVDD